MKSGSWLRVSNFNFAFDEVETTEDKDNCSSRMSLVFSHVSFSISKAINSYVLYQDILQKSKLIIIIVIM